ncbi:MAG: hypothetical protein ACI8UR_001407 [Natronomonas sp.]|jgi:hypothetical protein
MVDAGLLIERHLGGHPLAAGHSEHMFKILCGKYTIT